ncbi:MAG TPA: DUF4173 domain-containing protein [Longimicrobium sp.]|nr:DUF4173 domain-containing protein [Longimicrobium sp.]
MNAQPTLTIPVVRPAASPVPMSAATRESLRVLGAAAGLGVLGDLLLRPTPWGINLTLWTLALIGATVALRRRAGLAAAGRAWIPLALMMTALMTWRDSPTLKALDLAALCVVLGLAMHRAGGGRVRDGGVLCYARALGLAAIDAVADGPAIIFKDVKWNEVGGGRGARYAFPVARGAALAVPVLGIFTALLMSADARFAGMVEGAFQLDGGEVVGHAAMTGVVTWVAAGVLRSLAGDERPAGEPGRIGLSVSLGMVETAMVLGLVNFLFLAFVIVQLPYLFGAAPAGGALGYAEYARRGFFELVWVAGLVLPLLLAAHHLLRRDHARNERVFRWLAGAQVALLFVIIASAMHRMRLYQNAYGLTELRLYTSAFMVWLALVFAWFCATVLRGRRERFAFGALVVAADVLVLLHGVNPDARIVKTNAARAHAEAPFDARYAAGLSADAVAPLMSALAVTPMEERCAAAARLERRWGGEADWRSWSVARSSARRAVRAHVPALRAGCPAVVARTVSASFP